MRGMRKRIRIPLTVVVVVALFGVLGGCDNPAGSASSDDNGDELGNGDEGNQGDQGDGVYAIGDRGPAGGWIFYIDEADEFVWTYLEAASEEMEFRSQWGGTGALVGEDAQGTAIGTGASNTDAIVDFFDRLAHVDTGESYYDFDWDSVGGLEEAVFTDGSEHYSIVVGLHDGTVAAKACADLVVEHNGESYDDWFLPSIDELDLMRRNVRPRFTSHARFSSTESNDNSARYQFFGHAGTGTFPKHSETGIRAARAF